MSLVSFENSEIILQGQRVHSLHFRGSTSQHEYQEGVLLISLGEFRFKKTALHVLDGTAIYSNDARRYPYITVSEGSRIFADRLDVKNNSFVALDAYASFLSGRAHVEKGFYGSVELFNQSLWTVRANKNALENDHKKVPYCVGSSIFFVRLIDSFIFFQKPRNDFYQTLRVRRLDDDYGLDYAYVVGEDARLYVNAYLTETGKSKGIKADKLLIYGDVYGKSKVHIIDVSVASKKIKNHSKGKQKDDKKDSLSVSIIQVYGKAAEDSFKLTTDYVALRGAP
ncbi:hypothetical protein [Bartonella sp. TT110JLCBS]|uniref:hypothetical protein n=1 Tax=Bartonella sp. TT110JLCBS TaxID=3243578 RepID=UPI0035CF8DD6